ncbi:MAG: hypothetical protein OXF79_14795 [Chloroflexi bacterium]|nr:hypothetical protein [Chloroflexota bacterium]
MNKILWAGLGLLPAALLLLVARTLVCTSGGYFFSINMRCYSAFSTAVTLTIIAALLLLIIGCVVKALRHHEKYQPY